MIQIKSRTSSVIPEKKIPWPAQLNDPSSIKVHFNIILRSSEWYNLFVFPNNIFYVLYKPTMFVICHHANLISSYSIGSPVVLVTFLRRNFLKPITFFLYSDQIFIWIFCLTQGFKFCLFKLLKNLSPDLNSWRFRLALLSKRLMKDHARPSSSRNYIVI